MSYRCQEDLTKALDLTADPPTTKAEFERWVETWREEEMQRHEEPNSGKIAANEITVSEIESIIRTRKVRMEDARKHWAKVAQSHRGLPAGIVSINGVKGKELLCLGARSVRKWTLQDHLSVDIYSNLDDMCVRIVFSKEADRRLKVHRNDRNPTIQIACSGMLGAFDLKSKRFRIEPLWESPRCTEFSIDFSKGVEVGEENCCDNC